MGGVGAGGLFCNCQNLKGMLTFCTVCHRPTMLCTCGEDVVHTVILYNTVQYSYTGINSNLVPLCTHVYNLNM